MSGGITNIYDLERWFRGNSMPYFTVKYQGPGERIIYRNDNIEDLTEAWEELKHQVESQAGAGRALLEVMVYQKGKNNHPTRTNVEIRDMASARNQQSAISGAPQFGIGSIQEYVDNQVHVAMLERENQELKEALNSPTNTWERILDKISESPHLAGLVQTFIGTLMGKAGMPAPAVTGHFQPSPRQTDDEGNEITPPETDEQQELFIQNIQEVCATLGIDALTLAVKLNQLVQKNPAMAKTLITS